MSFLSNSYWGDFEDYPQAGESSSSESFPSESFPSTGSTAEFEALARTMLGDETNATLSDPPLLDEDDSRDTPGSSDWQVFVTAIVLSMVMFILGAGGVFAWRRYAPATFNETLEQVIDTLTRYVERFDGSSDVQD